MSFLQKKRLSRLVDFSEIKFDDLNQVGAGGFGKVYAGLLNQKKVGIKKITSYENDPNREKIEKFIEREIDILKFLSSPDFKHPNVIQYHGLALKENSLYLLTELVPGGDLHWYIKNDKVEISWKLKFQIARDIALGMAFIHSCGIIHRDIKSTNLLVDENWVIKICDMGLARQVDNINEKKLMTICGSDAWMSPEILLGEKYDNSCDVFSFGMVLIELIIRENLTPRLRNEDLGIDKQFLSTKIPEDCPKDLVKLVYECCQVKPSLRPSFAAIHNVLEYLLGHLQFQDVPLPKLRVLTHQFLPATKPQPSTIDQSFPRPYISTVNNNNNNNNNNNSNNNVYQQESMAFPVPHVPSKIQQQQQNVYNQPNQSEISDFSFPRPYQPSTINNKDTGKNGDESEFSFPRPYQPTVITMSPLIKSQNQQFLNKKDDEEEEEEEEEEEYRKPTSGSVMSFNYSELLSFPRPWNPDQEQAKKGPLIETPDYSFPRPYNPDTEIKPPTPPPKRKPILNASLTFSNQQVDVSSSPESHDDQLSISLRQTQIADQKDLNQTASTTPTSNNLSPSTSPPISSPPITIEDTSTHNTNNHANNNNNNGDVKIDHRRSRSLDLKTKVIIRKFEELTRFNSHHSWKSKDQKEKEKDKDKEKEKDKEHKKDKEKEKEHKKDKESKEQMNKEKSPNSQSPMSSPTSPTKKSFWKSPTLSKKNK
ncbi:LISK family protein kinase [Tieghemostelium lacteum]|uniref:non-specific serine/threonine protein kinase n=1 Tax=Tieghemostelium lacteum TaxID=361077 RepID=A0A151Z3E4_TIELA|nr:LISK family protein kinase [Tieghemostelium lacteum]|eukprot:KYQ88471.1 LISK family protein kinase [Tieghemostelium lacteum]